MGQDYVVGVDIGGQTAKESPANQHIIDDW